MNDLPQFTGYAGADETVAAVATAPGPGGVAVIRISGPGAKSVLTDVFRSSKPSFKAFRPYTLHHGVIVDADDRPLDEALVVFMPGPGSYTGEDTAEIQCHGGTAVTRSILAAALAAGAEPAGPGEFTRRAFLNGKLDLTQAEAVADMINAKASGGVSLAYGNLKGALGRKVRSMRVGLERLRADLCVAVDFPEEELECLPPQQLIEGVRRIAADIEVLLQAYTRAGRYRDGALVALTGRVNVGKSSLLNAMLGRERAIVSELPGATRDYLEEPIDLEGLPVRLVDTAGIRETEDALELAGLDRSRELVAQADLVVQVYDAAALAAGDEPEAPQGVEGERLLIALNKSDLVPDDQCLRLAAELERRFEAQAVTTSAETMEGLDGLAKSIHNRLSGRKGDAPAEAAPNVRQARLLAAALEELKALEADARAGMPYDVLGVRLEAATSTLQEITGEIASADVLNHVFSSFCIGK